MLDIQASSELYIELAKIQLFIILYSRNPIQNERKNVAPD